MQNSNIIFRRAVAKDVDNIWDLLHAQSITWNEVQITCELQKLFVIFQNERLYGVLYCSNLRDLVINWVATHPLYPEEPLKGLMTKDLQSFSMFEGINQGFEESALRKHGKFNNFVYSS